jgi:carboxyl-terminal processing protease
MRTFRWIIGFTLLAAAASAQEPATSNAVVRSIDEVAQILQRYNLSYDPAAAEKAVMEALVQAADPYGMILSEEEAARIREEEKGIFHVADVGLVATDGAVRVSEVKKGTPAEEAGLVAGETVVEIDNGVVAGLRLSELQELLRGPADEAAQLKVEGTNGAARDVEVKRTPLQAGTIQTAEDLPLGLCYLRLNGLYERSAKDIILTLRGWAQLGRNGVVVDLRGANGMDLDSAAEVASLFAEPNALLFKFQDGQAQDLDIHKATAGTPLDMPAIALVDEATSGAAEALAAAFAGSTRGVMLIGLATAADPAIREIVDLSDGRKLYIVTRRLVTANGKVCDGREGVKPALVVDGTEAEPDFEPEPAASSTGKTDILEEEKQHRQLRNRVRGDPALRRAVDVLLGLKALNIRGTGRVENPAP